MALVGSVVFCEDSWAAGVEAPSALRCIAVYGLIGGREPSPRRDAAVTAHDQMLANYRLASSKDVGLAVKAPEDAAAADATAGRLDPDETAGACDRTYRFRVAETSPVPYAGTAPKTISLRDYFTKGPPPTDPVPATPPSSPNGAGVLYTRCQGQNRSFDSGATWEALANRD